MKQKWILTGTALALAAALTGCGSNAPTSSQPQSSQQASYISMDAAQSAALDAASIAAADANFSATTLDDVAGITCYKVDFSAGGYDYAYSINAESGEVLEASYHEQAGAAVLPDGSTGTTTTQPSTTKPNVGAVTTAPAQTNTPNTNTSTSAVDEAKAQEIIAEARAKGQKIIVLAGRPYHIDPEINHGIHKLIASLGFAVITEDSVAMKVDTPALDVLNQWTYHSRLYRAAEYVCENDDMQLVQLVSFGCGIDAVTTDEVRAILEEKGKLYTQLKIDEITNLGAAKIRLRSLAAALEEKEASANAEKNAAKEAM